MLDDRQASAGDSDGQHPVQPAHVADVQSGVQEGDSVASHWVSSTRAEEALTP